jgi:Glycosyl hydrolase family 12/Cellulose binding domain
MKFTSTKRFLTRLLAVGMLSTSLSGLAATGDLRQTWTYGGSTDISQDKTVSTMFGRTTPSWGWPNLPVPSNGAAYDETANTQGTYRINLNYWNQDTFGGNVPSEYMTLSADDQTGAFTVTKSANSYYANGNPIQGCTPSSTSTEDVCRWAPARAGGNPIHAPAGYPSIYNGCHYNQCTLAGTLRDGTTVSGAPYPIKVNQITGIPSRWVVDTTQRKPNAIFNVAYDIWLDRNLAGHLPANPENVQQNDGLEIMIWMNNQGYNDVPGNTPIGGVITPIGERVLTDVVIKGVTGTWDVWVTTPAKGKAGGAIKWNVVSYIRKDRVDAFEFDSKWFIDHALTLDCADNEKCANKDWWLTSIQSGFEIWANGEGLSSKEFSAKPTWEATTVQGGATWTDPATGKTHPIIHWGQSFDVTASCPNPNPNDTGTWVFSGTDPATSQVYTKTGTLKPDSSGVLRGTVDAMYPAHNWATLTITTSCVMGGSENKSVNVWIDPAGTVKDQTGKALVGAKVTLLRSNTANGPFTIVANGSTIMSPTNRRNPDLTGQYGDFSWDVTPGFYKVEASFGKCHVPGNPNDSTVESKVFQIPPPALGIQLVLECPQSPGTGLPYNVSISTDWGTGYCANVTVTNNTSKPIDWKVTLPVQGTITQFWNTIWKQQGNQVTIEGVSWNNILQPKTASHSIGFCANR